MVECYMKDIPGYEGRFAVTLDGRVWSHPKPLTGVCAGKGSKCGRWLRSANSRGYRVVGLGKCDQQAVHRLVALTYLPKVLGRSQINHKNGKKSDNRVENLEWCTQAENNAHAWATGLCRAPRKVSLDLVPQVRDWAKSGISQTDIAAMVGVGRSTIQRVIHGTHGY